MARFSYTDRQMLLKMLLKMMLKMMGKNRHVGRKMKVMHEDNSTEDCSKMIVVKRIMLKKKVLRSR